MHRTEMESCLRNGAAVDMIQLARSLPGLGGGADIIWESKPQNL